MFDRPHHQQIAVVLGCLDASVLAAHQCFFGGGTAIALRYGEYRESVDIDFLVSDASAYRGLRGLLATTRDITPLLVAGQRVLMQAPLRSDQYGLRTRVSVGDVEIKFEIVHEGRITFDTPGAQDRVCGVASLTVTDLIASKLLANADRWMDDGVFSRDILDLALIAPDLRSLRSGSTKAVAAYGDSAVTDAIRALSRLREREDWLARCMAAMAMTMPRAVVVQRLRDLSMRLEKLSAV